MKNNFIATFIFIVISLNGLYAHSPSDCLPQPGLQEQIHNKITVRNIVNATELRLLYGDCVQDSSWQIESFRIIRCPKKGDSWTSQNAGAEFSSETRNILRKTKRWDIVFFEDIILVNSRGERRELTEVIEVY